MANTFTVEDHEAGFIAGHFPSEDIAYARACEQLTAHPELPHVWVCSHVKAPQVGHISQRLYCVVRA